MRKVPGTTVDYVYDHAGRQIAELNTSGGWTREEMYVGGRHLATYNGTTTYFHNADWLGTERVRTDVTGAIYETCQSLPYGDGQVCAGGDPSPMHFTGKQRDTETNLDDFPARYYSSTQGRWLSPDWDDKPVAVPYAILGNPQTLNLYSYVGGDPTNHSDPDGHMELCSSCGASADSSSEAQNQGSGQPGDEPRENPAQMSSLQFLGQELKGVYDVTAGPVVEAATHPVQTVENALSNLVEGVKDVAKDPKGTLTGAAEGAKDLAIQFGSKVASGDPRAIGQAVGVAATVAYTAENVRVGSYEHGGGGANLKNTPLNGNRIALDAHPFGKAGTATASRNVVHMDIKIQQLGINVRHWTPW